jgi:ribosomal protein S18 acetylase RimI-like enzyme
MERSNITVCSSRPEDLDALCEMIGHGKEALAAAGVPQWNDGYPSRESIAADIEKGVSYTVKRDGTPIATAVIITDGEPDYNEIYEGRWISDGPYVAVHRIATHNDAKRTGAASLLVRQAEEIARANGFSSVRIDTHRKNLVMQAFLEKNGFRSCGVIYLRRSGAERIAFEKIL